MIRSSFPSGRTTERCFPLTFSLQRPMMSILLTFLFCKKCDRPFVCHRLKRQLRLSIKAPILQSFCGHQMLLVAFGDQAKWGGLIGCRFSLNHKTIKKASPLGLNIQRPWRREYLAISRTSPRQYALGGSISNITFGIFFAIILYLYTSIMFQSNFKSKNPRRFVVNR